MNIEYNWKQDIDISIKQNLKKKIEEWIQKEDFLNNKKLSIELSFTDPLDTVLSGMIKDSTDKIICTFTSNEFFDNMSKNFLKE